MTATEYTIREARSLLATYPDQSETPGFRPCFAWARSENGGTWYCTRSKGHEGDHAAHVIGSGVGATWPQEGGAR